MVPVPKSTWEIDSAFFSYIVVIVALAVVNLSYSFISNALTISDVFAMLSLTEG